MVVCNHHKLLWSGTEHGKIHVQEEKRTNPSLQFQSRCLILNTQITNYQQVSWLLLHYLFKVSECLGQ